MMAFLTAILGCIVEVCGRHGVMARRLVVDGFVDGFIDRFIDILLYPCGTLHRYSFWCQVPNCV